MEDHAPVWNVYGAVHHRLNNHNNITPVKIQESVLRGTPPVVQDLGRMLPFKNGMVYDFAQHRA